MRSILLFLFFLLLPMLCRAGDCTTKSSSPDQISDATDDATSENIVDFGAYLKERKEYLRVIKYKYGKNAGVASLRKSMTYFTPYQQWGTGNDKARKKALCRRSEDYYEFFQQNSEKMKKMQRSPISQ